MLVRLAMTAAALALTFHVIDVLDPSWPVSAVLLAAALAPMVRAPLVVAWVTVGAAAVHLLVLPGSGDVLLWVPPAAPFAAYLAMRHGSPRLAAAAPVVVFTALGLWWAPTLEFGIRTGLLTAAAALLGLYLSARHGLLRALTDRAERAEREQHLLAEQARGEERVRLAADIHDLVTHRVSLMVLQAGALGLTTDDPSTRQAAETLRATGCQALDELRELVGVLRAPSAQKVEPVEEQPLLPALEELVAAAGLPASLEADGDALVSPVVLRTARRAVQESLTNVRKHAPGAVTTVRLRSAGATARLTITNTAPDGPGDPELAAAGSGTGLLGLRERVSLVDGSLTAGPSEEGGFRVEVTLPGRAAS
ncbi:sensor histidine kinase [Nonomuraea sp. NPDC050556]|uniref:sensor histidine kinase n=1 Tax=Nonomuraea sp. NPDC050556 TaxID=3364369 RepID=UPI00378C2505